MNTIDGKTISECFALVSRVGSELEGLGDTLSNLLMSGLEAESGMPCVAAADAIEDVGMDDSGWVYTDMAWSLPLKAPGRGKTKTKQYLGYQISLLGDGIKISDNAEPLLHVFCWKNPVKFDQDEWYAGFPFEETKDDPFEVVDSRLCVWGGREATDWSTRSWMYSLRLTALNSPDDLKKYIVEPALALLKGMDVATALPDRWLEGLLFRYPAKEHLL